MNIESPKDLACLYFKWHFQSDLKRVKVTAGNWKGVCASEYSKEAKTGGIKMTIHWYLKVGEIFSRSV